MTVRTSNQHINSDTKGVTPSQEIGLRAAVKRAAAVAAVKLPTLVASTQPIVNQNK